jgi:hypothetical protein
MTQASLMCGFMPLAGYILKGTLKKIHAYTKRLRQELDLVLKALWQLYQKLKSFKARHDNKKKPLMISMPFATGKPNGWH